MSSEEEDEIILREFKKRGNRGLCKLLTDIQRKLTRPSGWYPTLAVIVYRAEKLNLEVKFK